MRTVGAYEAKTHLSQLLDEVEQGDTITITRHGVPVAELRPLSAASKRDIGDAIGEMKIIRREIGNLNGLTIREMIEEGRRY